MKRCSCKICRLSRCLQRITKKCTPAERAALDTLWTRMKSAETRYAWLMADIADGKVVTRNGKLVWSSAAKNP